MKNIVGAAVSGENFFDRPNIINKITRSLESGNHVYLSAPRRVGKTSIMNHFREIELNNYYFIYEITESVGDIEDFYKVLAKKVLESPVLGKMAKTTEKFKNAVEKLIHHLNVSVDLPFVKISTQNTEKVNFHLEFERILEELDLGEAKLVIMIDEFPKTLENIMSRKNNQEAIRFLQTFRDIIHNSKINGKVQFLLTGSVGLPPIVKKLESLHLITMLNIIEVPPLSTSEAKKLLQLILDNYAVKIQPDAIDTVLSQIDWLIPFHIQLAAQEIIDVYETESQVIDNQLVAVAFNQILHYRNNIYFEIYLERLKKNLEMPDYKLANEVLNIIAKNDKITKGELYDLAVKHQLSDTYRATIESLMYDGYINNQDNSDNYRFNSSILKLWWKKYVC